MGRKQRIALGSLIMIFVLSPPVFAVKTVIASGIPVGVRMTAQGVVVCGMQDIEGRYGSDCPAKDAGLRTGDILHSINGEKISSGTEFASKIADGNGEAVVIEGKRSDVGIKATIQPIKSSSDGGYHLGLLVRDSMAGIGTVTYIDPSDGSFGALGHPVTEIDSGTVLPLADGSLMPAEVVGIRKGKCGAAGELTGAFRLDVNAGRITKNTQSGIFGKMNSGNIFGKTVQTAMPEQVRTGKAEILTCTGGVKPELYQIEIRHINKNAGSKALSIRVTDDRLIEKTGGIVQGMSGSPIIQNGKLVGAVTHVFLNDPTKGYGILAETMLSEQD